MLKDYIKAQIEILNVLKSGLGLCGRDKTAQAVPLKAKGAAGKLNAGG